MGGFVNLNPYVGTIYFLYSSYSAWGSIQVEEYYGWKFLLYINQGYTHGEASKKKLDVYTSFNVTKAYNPPPHTRTGALRRASTHWQSFWILYPLCFRRIQTRHHPLVRGCTMNALVAFSWGEQLPPILPVSRCTHNKRLGLKEGLPKQLPHTTVGTTECHTTSPSMIARGAANAIS